MRMLDAGTVPGLGGVPTNYHVSGLPIPTCSLSGSTASPAGFNQVGSEPWNYHSTPKSPVPRLASTVQRTRMAGMEFRTSNFVSVAMPWTAKID
jgi:hypothetical protein